MRFASLGGSNAASYAGAGKAVADSAVAVFKKQRETGPDYAGLSKVAMKTASDERIAATVAHCQPMGDQEDEVDIFELVHSWLAHAGQEVDVVGQPAEAEDDHHRDQHHHRLLLLVEILPVLVDGAVAPVAGGD